MKMKIKIKRINKNILFPTIIKNGEWVDLRASKHITLKGPNVKISKVKNEDGKFMTVRKVTFDYTKIPLGIAMELPKGFEGNVLPRSGTFGNYKILLCNSEGVIDNSYNGDNDEWKFQAIAFEDSVIEENDRICQFRITLSQHATLWQKIKWLLSSGIEFVEVDTLGNEDRKGFGSTGIK